MSLKFKRNKEDFTCDECGFNVQGDGFTNHCPQCLWSKHVDINPGDREEKCKGMMKPVNLFLKDGEYSLIHECLICGIERKNRMDKKDNFDSVLNILK
jgi:hypothetical protein